MASPPAAATGDKPAKAKKPVRAAKPSKPKFSFFSIDSVEPDVMEERVEHARMNRMYRIVRMQTIAIAVLAIVLIIGMPFFQTIFQYYALTSDRKTVPLTPLIIPNMTNQAVLSWATNSITEIMTFGFGDYQTHLRAQRIRFTANGWTAFVGAFDKMKMGEAFRQRQLVLTTVPSNTAVIISQGENKKHVYEWRVQLPVIMTYATNDNVTRRERSLVVLTLVRVPSSESPAGIAIQSWDLGQ